MSINLNNCPGRLCNKVFRNLAIHFIAKKFNISCIYQSNDLMEELGIKLYNGSNIYNNKYNNICIEDNNYFSILNKEKLDFNIIICNGYFQTREISHIIYKYLQENDIKEQIILKNFFKERYNNNNDIFIHIRLDDVEEFNPGLKYYINALDKIKNYDNIYICSDSLDHYIIKQLLEKYTLAKLLIYNEIKTIQFGSTCKYIILSHGSFSSIIGYFGFYSTIYYPEYNGNKIIWYGDIFNIEGWNMIPLQSYI